MKKRFKKQKGQAIVEYIIIVVVIALAALVVLGAFSDRIRAMIGGVTSELGGEHQYEAGSADKEKLTELTEDGFND